MKNTDKWIKIINALARTANATSDPFKPNKDGSFVLTIDVNGGTGTQTLVGTFALKGRVDLNEAMKTISSYSFTSGPAGSAWTYTEAFDGAYWSEMQLVFTYVSGTGDIVARFRTP